MSDHDIAIGVLIFCTLFAGIAYVLEKSTAPKDER
jgi:hypothetical protein